jgi:hypothetical protein
MPHPRSILLSDRQVALLETRRRALGLSGLALLERFELALSSKFGCPTRSTARMRLDRVLHRTMRRPTSEATRLALARALDWRLEELEAHLDLSGASVQSEKFAGPLTAFVPAFGRRGAS